MTKTEMKSWKKINQDRKEFKKKRKQDKLIKQLEQAKKLTELQVQQEKEMEIEENQKPVSTLSIAVPGSILENAQSMELRTYLAGQIARAACIFKVDEIVVFDDQVEVTRPNANKSGKDADGQRVRASSLQLARILQYLECPQYLRKFFFPMHSDLQYSALLNPLDAPHHLRQQNVFVYREGIVLDKKSKKSGCYVNVGLLNDVQIDKPLTAGVRVTVKIEDPTKLKHLKGTAVSPSEPTLKTGVYWGYTVRLANTLSEVFSQSPHADGYDAIVGTSDRGDAITSIDKDSIDYHHSLIVFGGLKGLEAVIEHDDKLDVEDPKSLFEHYINVLPNQGSRTIRTEEAILITMAALSEKMKPKVPRMDNKLADLLPQSSDT